MSKEKSDNDSPADWAARHAQYSRLSSILGPALDEQLDETQIRLRAEQEEEQRRRYRKALLVERAENAWRHEKEKQALYYHDEDDPIARICDPDNERSCPNVSGRMVRSRKWRRLFLVLLACVAGFCYLCTHVIIPDMEHDYELQQGFLKHAKGTFGLAMGGDLEIKETITQLDDLLLPGGAADVDGNRRLIFVGDIHGCKHELLELLQQVDFDQEKDQLIVTGDVINKGPDSLGVIDELIRVNATGVRGNHEDRLLTLAAVKVDKYGHPEHLSKTSQRDAKLLEELKPHHLAFLQGLPLILRIPPMPLAKKWSSYAIRSEILVVHAGLVPAVPLAKQDPYFVMNMRSLKQKNHAPSIEPASKEEHLMPWTESWNWYHSRIARGHSFTLWHRYDPGLEEGDGTIGWSDCILNLFRNTKIIHKSKAQVVVYGHDSRVGFLNKRWSKGLDSRCVRGGQLTAMILDAHGRESFVHVNCEDYRE